jgi:hypothetical protein
MAGVRVRGLVALAAGVNHVFTFRLPAAGEAALIGSDL